MANAINAGRQTETQYISSLLIQVQNTTIPAVAVEGSMYGAVGSSAEVTLLTIGFLPAQVANAVQNGFNPLVYASETLGLAFSFGNETGSTAFITNFGPTNAFLPNTAAGDAAFTSAAVKAIFGSAATATLETAMNGWVANWKAFYSANGIPALSPPTLIKLILPLAAPPGGMRSAWRSTTI
jgi:hypothetical protein